MQLSKEIAVWLMELQDEICNGLAELDGKSFFREDKWEREEGGGGRSRVIEDGSIFEKGGVNFSHVHGKAPDFLFSEKEHSITNSSGAVRPGFSATGISIVMHPQNPHVPIIHMNIRFFEMDNGVYWFGGGIDLTPHYYSEDQYSFFHTEIKKMCDRHHQSFYPDFSKWADQYFYLPHRKETRGIGGIFFDRLKENENFKFDLIKNFWQDTGKLFLPLYTQIVKNAGNKTFTEKEKQWQLLRRGRYVEFNLLYDKGTRFGLETGGRTESILMSLPKNASWLYNFQPEPGSEEEKTISFLRRESR
jgi:coproporphyrinogen III oxidase